MKKVIILLKILVCLLLFHTMTVPAFGETYSFDEYMTFRGEKAEELGNGSAWIVVGDGFDDLIKMTSFSIQKDGSFSVSGSGTFSHDYDHQVVSGFSNSPINHYHYVAEISFKLSGTYDRNWNTGKAEISGKVTGTVYANGHLNQNVSFSFQGATKNVAIVRTGKGTSSESLYFRCAFNDGDLNSTVVTTYPNTNNKLTDTNDIALWLDFVPEGELTASSFPSQIATMVAPKNPGENIGTTIWNEIVDGVGNSDTAARIGISLGGALATAGALSMTNSGKKDNNRENEKKKRKTYKMKVYKNFGDSIHRGADPVSVWARIAEIEEDGQITRENIRDDLTARISASGEGMDVKPCGMENSYMGAKVSIPADSKAETATLIFTFTGAASVMHNRITFRVIGEPEIVFIDQEYCAIYDRRETAEDLLIGDNQGTVMLIGLKNFSEDPGKPDIRGENFVITSDPVTVSKLPDVYAYRVMIKNNYYTDSPYGIWPLEQEITITAANKSGERAEGKIACQLWPDGIFFDTRQLYPKQIRKESDGTISICVDTSVIYASAGEMNYMENAYMDTGVAYKDPTGLVIVDKPNEPGDRTYFRLGSADNFSEMALSRIWYELIFGMKPSYHSDDRLGTLSLNPLMPMVVSNENAEYKGKFTIWYIKESQYFEHTVFYSLTGINKDMNDADRETEIKQIRRLLDRMRTDDMHKVLQVLHKYGVEAENDLLHFGSEKSLSDLDLIEQELLDMLYQIQSLQRLRFIRKTVYDTLYFEVIGEKIEANTWADWTNMGFWLAKSFRYAADVGFTIWCYLMFKQFGAAIEPILTPIKDLFLDYVSSCSDIDKWLKGNNTLNPFKFLNMEKITNTMMTALENSLVNLMITAVIDQGKSPMTWAEIISCFGTISAFIFAKNLVKYTDINPKTGLNETDMWKVLKGTMKDITIDTLKVIVSATIGRIFNRIFKAPTDEERISIVRENITPKLKQAFYVFIDKNPTYGPPPHYWYKFYRFCRLQGKTDIRFSVWYRFHIKGETGNFRFNETANEQLHSLLDYMCSAIFGQTIDFTKDGAEDTRTVQMMENKLDQWAASFENSMETIEIPAMDGGDPVQIKVPFMVKVFLFVEYAFEKLRLRKENCEDFSEVMPDESPYWTRKQTAEEMKKIPGLSKEAEFVENPESEMTQEALDRGSL